MSGHTPGPWAFSRWDEYGDTRFYVAQAEGAPYTPNYSDVATLVAETVSIERVAIQEANARLIAAAPDLRDELINLTARFKAAVMQAGTDEEFAELAVASARAAIAKATGSAS